MRRDLVEGSGRSPLGAFRLAWSGKQASQFLCGLPVSDVDAEEDSPRSIRRRHCPHWRDRSHIQRLFNIHVGMVASCGVLRGLIQFPEFCC